MSKLTERIAIAIRDWRRGYRDIDIVSAANKLASNQGAGGIVPMTLREMRSIGADGCLGKPKT